MHLLFLTNTNVTTLSFYNTPTYRIWTSYRPLFADGIGVTVVRAWGTSHREA